MFKILAKMRNLPACSQIDEHSLSRIWRRIQLGNLFAFAINTFSFILYTTIVILEHVTSTMRGLWGQEVVRKVEQGVQTHFCYQDITELIIHHFGSLHEKDSLRKIAHKIQWKKLNSDIECVKENLHQQDARTSVLVSIKEDIESLKKIVQQLAISMDGNYKSSTALNIPPPPPLPPPGFFLPGTILQSSIVSKLDKRNFEQNIPPRPIITVETLRQVKLKKTHVPFKID